MISLSPVHVFLELNLLILVLFRRAACSFFKESAVRYNTVKAGGFIVHP